ncbi:hypothetical protein Mesci_2571 [Mesorhizobium ciceri biovar biserrulae WSM1271]|uniref:Uncharacterized protein n=2 Tax=Mesorhizobium ciceri TaxID=39645 RepID=E8T7I4_MESCW|nr:hypothetical protein Mesci_2571 [Mesorhizobium ciceri biovar biserrulae WSM1271]
MVRLLVEEARHALLQPNEAQRERDDRVLISTSTAGTPPAQWVRSPAQMRSFRSMSPNVRKTKLATVHCQGSMRNDTESSQMLAQEKFNKINDFRWPSGPTIAYLLLYCVIIALLSRNAHLERATYLWRKDSGFFFQMRIPARNLGLHCGRDDPASEQVIAEAYMADVTEPQKHIGGMGVIAGAYGLARSPVSPWPERPGSAS